MYFEIENTPEHIRRARRAEPVQKKSPKEERPRLTLAPFARPPQVVFENITIGTCCERTLEVFNPSKQVQQITLGRSLPTGLVIELPGDWLVLEPETCYLLSFYWTPVQPTALRDTIRFTNETRGRYDVIVVLKTGMGIQVKGKHAKGFKISPGKIKKKPVKKSPVAIYKKKAEVIYNTTKIKKTVNIYQSSSQHRVLQPSNKENICNFNDYSMNSQMDKCPFDSPTSIDFNFDTSEVFSNMRKPISENFLQKTYDKSFTSMPQNQNTLKPSNKQTCNISGSDIFDNLTFTPLKGLPSKSDKLDKGPKIIMSMNSESDFDDSLDLKQSNKENETHSIISITSTQPPNRWLTVNHHTQLDSQYIETPTLQSKKIPNTSSPKELNSPNFSINTEFSRISELSFFPQRFSTERKGLPRLNNETHDIIDEANTKLSSDTYTKDSPNTPVDFQMYTVDAKPPHYFSREQQPKMCRQALFKEFQLRELRDKNYMGSFEHNLNNINLHNDLKVDVKSPPRSVSPPPLQSIPEESSQFSDTHILDRTDKQMTTFTINRTFDKDHGKTSINNRQSWSKKSVRVEPELWKVPTSVVRKTVKPKQSLKGKESLGSRLSNATFEADKTYSQNMSLTNHIGNVYSQSFTVDPFLSTTYFYDEEAVDKFEKEFKRWLNCILTPPADLDSNIEQKIDVGKAWLENRNKEVPLAPTKEHVCNVYHNSHRLASLRRSARNLLMSPEIAQVFQKLNAQIEKKLIAIRTDRNLHLDVGLQKIIMEILLSYNPLWLRLGLEAIYGLVLPLKSNSDIEGLTTFIIQRMFKNPHLKNKHSKSNVPNMLLPAYMEAIKKFTLKKFFMLVFFLDQAKQRKLISHDPCLFCRNAVCKESREIIIRFTRELIAGIGDITKHLRPLGYIVSHKQSYLDEYKYAVHNIAVDIRDGVRLTKVMEIILMKNGLVHQLRTPAISRLQKIHNVQVALSALKEANFVIVGDITAHDIADGHREKTLSLLWQLIHVFRAPLFEKAANVIQTWWKKKYEVIVQKRKEEEKIQQKLNKSATVIQRWWRCVQYNRLVEWQMLQVTNATVIIQRYCRMWLCRRQYRRMKMSVLKMEEWYKSIKEIRSAKNVLKKLRAERELLQQKSATIIQTSFRRWLCMKKYKLTLKKIVLIQSLVRRFLVRKHFITLKKYTIMIQKKYRSKAIMKLEILNLTETKKKITIIQSYYRMIREYKNFQKLKKSVITIQTRYRAVLSMRKERKKYLEIKKSAIKLQSLYRGKRIRLQYMKQRLLIVQLQRKIRAKLLMKKESSNFLRMKHAAITIQNRIKAHQAMKKVRGEYLCKRKSAITIQKYFRSYLQAKSQRTIYIKLRCAAVTIQKCYRNLLIMREHVQAYQKQRNAIIAIQRQFRAYIIKKKSAIIIQSYYRMIKQYRDFQKIKMSVMVIQKQYRAVLSMRSVRKDYLKLKYSAVVIQSLYRGKKARLEYLQQRQSIINLQRQIRAHQLMKKERNTFLKIRKAAIRIQITLKAYLSMKKTREEYLAKREAAVKIQNYLRAFLLCRLERTRYTKLRNSVLTIQRSYRSLLKARKDRNSFLKQRNAIVRIQRYYRACVLKYKYQDEYKRLNIATVTLQRRFRALRQMRQERASYMRLKWACLTVQRRFRIKMEEREQRRLQLKLRTEQAVQTIQKHYRARRLMLRERTKYLTTLKACIQIQNAYRAYLAGKIQRQQYLKIRSAAVNIQRHYRYVRETRQIRNEFLRLKNTIIFVQRRFRANMKAREIRRDQAACKIQTWYRTLQKRNICRRNFVQLKVSTITVQSTIRMYILRKRFLTIRRATITIQRYYRSYKVAVTQRQEYVQTRNAIVQIQAFVKCYIERLRYLKIRRAVTFIQAVYRFKKYKEFMNAKREAAAICIQKHIRRYIVQSRYEQYRNTVIYLQKLWKGKLVTRLLRCEFLQKRNVIIRLQAAIRGYLVRKVVQLKRENLVKIREEKREYWAASKIQALFRGHKARVHVNADKRVAELRRRWREGALESTQESLKERNEEAMEVLRKMSDIETVIRAFRSLELLTEVFPMMYHDNAASIVRRVYIYMSVTNRSISSVEVLKSAASVLVNLTRYRITGPKIYARDRIAPILKFMWRFSNSETNLFCILCTYIWLFSKYEEVRNDLTELLHTPENHKMMTTIKGNVDRMKRMATNAVRNKYNTPQPTKFVSHTGNQSLNQSVCSIGGNCSILLPALEPDYGIIRADKPRYFEEAQQAINCLFHTYKL